TVAVNGGATYTFQGFVRAEPGVEVRPRLSWLTSGGLVEISVIDTDRVPNSSTFVQFSTTVSAPGLATSAAIKIVVNATSGGSSVPIVCLDDISFHGPSFVPPSATPQGVAPPPPPPSSQGGVPTSTRTAVPTRTPTQTHTPRPTRTITQTHTPV